MIIKTKYGTIDSDGIKGDSEGAEFLKGHVDAAEIFFAEDIEIDLDEEDNNIKDSVIELLVENKYTYPERALALADENDISFDDIDEPDWGDGKIFNVGTNDEWMVITDDEADKETINHIKDSLDDIGMFELFNKNFQNTILKNDELIDNSWFNKYMEEDTRSYVDEIENESEIDEPEEGDYLNRLHEELCYDGIMDEPEYPELPDEDDKDYDKIREEYDNYIDKLKDIIDDNKEKLINDRINNYNNGVEWYRDNFGDESLKELVENNNLADNKKIAEWVFDNGYTSRGNELASYDGKEIEISVDYKDENYWFYLYRIN